MDKLELLNQIQLNGIKGVDGVIDMIIDTIDDGDKEGAKDWLRQLKDEIYEKMNLKALQCSVTAPEAGGWVRKKHNSVDE